MGWCWPRSTLVERSWSLSALLYVKVSSRVARADGKATAANRRKDESPKDVLSQTPYEMLVLFLSRTNCLACESITLDSP